MANSKFPAAAEPNSLSSRLRKMEWRVTRLHDQALKVHGVNMYQAMALIYVAYYGQTESVNQRRIEKYLYLSNPGVSKIVAFLEKEGYILRTPDPKDARSHLLTATEKGSAFADVLEDAIHLADEEILSPLSSQERKLMMSLLQKIGEA